MDVRTLPLAQHERCPSFAERDPRRSRYCERRRVAPQRGIRRNNVAAPDAPARRQIEVTPAVAPPQRPVGRVDTPAGGATIARDRHRHLSKPAARGLLNSTAATSVLNERPACTTVEEMDMA